MTEKPERKLYSMELPVDLVKAIDRLARKHHRSRQGEVAQALEEYVKLREREHE